MAALLALGRACVVLALWDLKRLLEQGAQGPAKKGARAAARKALFFAVWSNEQEPACYAMLQAEVGGVRARLDGALAEHSVTTNASPHKHTLIEEL